MIVRFKEIEKKVKNLKKNGKKIVLCHGGFDLIHPGHLDHLKKAKSFGDILIVSTTGDDYFEKGIGRPFYNEKKRTIFLNSIKYVDYVTVIPFKYAKEAILKIKPDVYCKGFEYKNNNNQNFSDDVKAVNKIKGKIHFIGNNIESSTKIIEKKNNFKKIDNKITISDIQTEFKKIKNKKILVIGETILDIYNYVKIRGITSKSTVISGEYIKSEIYNGGAFKIFENISNFVKNCNFLTLCNHKNIKFSKIFKNNKNIKAFHFDDYINIEKIKYVGENKLDKKNNELEKYFAVSKINNNFIYTKNMKAKILTYLKKNLKKYDLVVVADYGHGLVDNEIASHIQKYSKKLSINCQSNSMNFGFNIISDKYKKCNNFVLDHKEICLAIKNNKVDDIFKLKLLSKKLKCQTSFLTVGNKYSIGLDKNNISKIQPLSKNLIDTIGAGDAYFSINSILFLSKLNIAEKNFISQVAGGYACGYENNQYTLNLDNILKFFKNFFKNETKHNTYFKL